MNEDHYWEAWGYDDPVEAHVGMFMLAVFVVFWIAFAAMYVRLRWRDRHWMRAQKLARKARYAEYLARKNSTTNREGTA